MKLLVTISFLILTLSLSSIFAQSDSSKSIAKENETKAKKSEDQIMPTFDKSKRKRDVFIDKDGDGICDNRADGMSFETMRNRKQKGAGNGNNGGRK